VSDGPLGLSAAARLLGVSPVTLRRWSDAGHIECFRTPGGQRRFRRRDIDRLLGADGEPSGSPSDGRPAAAPSAGAPLTESERMFTSLRHAGRAISSSVVLEEVLDTIARATAEALGTSDCIIFSYDAATDELEARAIFEQDPTGYVIELNDPFLVDEYPGGRALLERGGVLEERLSDPDLDPANRASMLEYNEKSSLSVGLRFADEPLGLLVMTEIDHERRFTEAERELAMALGEQAAIALHNSAMFRRQREQNARLASLLESSRAVATSEGLDGALKIVAQRAVEGLGVAQCLISEYDEALDAAIPRALFERVPSGWDALNMPIPLAESRVDQEILRSGRPLLERISDPDLDPNSREAMETWGTKACLTVPLRLGDKSTGFLTLWETDVERRFTEDEVALAVGLSEQAAVAIHNAQLFRRLEAQNRRLSSLLDVSRASASSLVLDEVLSKVVEATIETFKVDTCVIWEYEAARDVLVERCAKDVDSDYQATGEVWPLAERPSEAAILRGREPVVETISDPGLEARSRASMEQWGEKTCLSVPLWGGDEAKGLLILITNREERHFSEVEIELARGLGEQAAAAIHNAQLFAALRLRTRETELLNEVARKATASLNVVEVARVTVDEIERLMRFDRAALLLAEGDGVLRAVFASEGQPAMLEGSKLAALDGDVRSALGEKRVVVLDLSLAGSEAAGHPSLDGLRSVALVGLARDDTLTGVLALGNSDDKGFSPAGQRFLEDLGTHLSLAINNASLFESVKLMHLGNLRALSSALNAKDYYTLGHTARVAAYAVLLAGKLGWSPELIEQVEEIAYLHDIGKIAVSDRSLLKPGPLSDEEWELMREHPVISAEIIEPLLGEHLVAGVRHHHESYDGSGYPDGLKGEGISPMARLLCVVDSYDAMSSLRLYRQARTYRECLVELEVGKGRQFDPQMVEAFVGVLEDLRELKREALVAAWEAATDIDGATHTRLADPQASTDEDRERITDLLGESARDSSTIAAMATEIRIDEHRSMIVTVCSDDPQRVQRRGEILLSDQEQMEAYAGRPMDTNVLYVDDQGAWVCGLAPIFGASGEIVGLVRSEVPATDVTGPLGAGSNVRQTFAGLAHDAASRLMRVEIDSMIDGLSGLYNHRYLHERLSEEVARAHAEGTQITVLFCDVDNFKQINDLHGHRVGDDLLRRMAHAIGKAIRRVDLAARYGGDEFAVVLIDSGPDMGLEVAERIRASIAALSSPPGGEAPTVSIGVATLPGDATTKTELLDKADWAMYLAKRRGRNRCVRFGEERE
jgi:diguanylate cyclase (GGDEF)-like protein/excisionase family DNA binding protein